MEICVKACVKLHTDFIAQGTANSPFGAPGCNLLLCHIRLQKQPFLSLRLWPEHRCFQCCHHGLCSHVTSTDIVQQHILAYCIMGQSLFPKQCMSMQRQGALANPQQGSVQHSNSWHQKCHSLPSSLSTPAGVVSSLMILLKR